MDHLDTSGQWRKVDGQPLAGNPIDTDTEGNVSRREEIGPEYAGIPPLLDGGLLPFGDRRRGICPSARQLAEIGKLCRVTQRIGGLVAPGTLNPHTVGVVLDDGFVVGIYEPVVHLDSVVPVHLVLRPFRLTLDQRTEAVVVEASGSPACEAVLDEIEVREEGIGPIDRLGRCHHGLRRLGQHLCSLCGGGLGVLPGLVILTESLSLEGQHSKDYE